MIDTNIKKMLTAQIIVVLIAQFFDILNRNNRGYEKIGWVIVVISVLLTFFVIVALERRKKLK